MSTRDGESAQRAPLEPRHHRSLVECGFSMLKAKSGDRLCSESETAQASELLSKVLCYNICCLIQMHV
jgi:hypothetical protein